MIRKAREEDLDAIMTLWLQSNLQAHSFVDAAYWRGNDSPVRKAIAKAEVYVEEKEGEIRGFMGLSQNYVAGIFVDSHFRSQGIGGSLLKWAKERKPELTLHVYEENTRAVAFYKNQGFSVTNRDLEPETGCMELEMRWERDG